MKKPKIALAHEFLNQYGGAEKTFEAVAELFPDAPIYTAKLNKAILPESLKNRIIYCPESSFINRASKYLFTFMMAPVFESFDFGDYDLIISDGNTWNKGILTKPDQLHITYIHTPPRFLYKYSTESTKRDKWYFKLFFSYLDNILRLWDFVAAQRPDYILTNSQETKKRIYKFYRREAQVIYPPVETTYKSLTSTLKIDTPYYLAVGRLTKYKNFDLLINAINKTNFKLVISGTGGYENELKKLAGPNIKFLGRTSDEEKHYLLENAKGLINPVCEEDFGIVPIEAMAHGTPVLAHKSGGHLETLTDNEMGMFFTDSNEASLAETIKEFDKKIDEKLFNKEKAKQFAAGFAKENFQKRFKDFVDQKWQEFNK